MAPMADAIGRGALGGTSTMTCRELNDCLTEYTSGEIGPEKRRALERHVGRCPACAAYLRSYRRMLRQIRPGDDLLDQLTPNEAPGELVDAILDATVRRAKPSRRGRG